MAFLWFWFFLLPFRPQNLGFGGFTVSSLILLAFSVEQRFLFGFNGFDFGFTPVSIGLARLRHHGIDEVSPLLSLGSGIGIGTTVNDAGGEPVDAHLPVTPKSHADCGSSTAADQRAASEHFFCDGPMVVSLA